MSLDTRALIERFHDLPLAQQEAIQKAYYTQLYGFFPTRLDKTFFRKISAEQHFAESQKNEIAFALFLETYFQ